MTNHREYRLKKLAQNVNYDKERREKRLQQRREESKRWAKEHPLQRKNAQLKYRYGISLDEYERQLKTQQYKCSICTKTFDDTKRATRPVVDHDHITGKVRKLLCNNCNALLGYANDKIELLEKAINYIKENQGQGGQ